MRGAADAGVVNNILSFLDDLFILDDLSFRKNDYRMSFGKKRMNKNFIFMGVGGGNSAHVVHKIFHFSAEKRLMRQGNGFFVEMLFDKIRHQDRFQTRKMIDNIDNGLIRNIIQAVQTDVDSRCLNHGVQREHDKIHQIF